MSKTRPSSRSRASSSKKAGSRRSKAMAWLRTTYIVRRASTCAAVALALATTDVDAAVRVARTGGTVRIASSKAVAEVRLASFRLRVRDRGGRLLTGEANEGGLFFERSGGTGPVTLGRVHATARTSGGAILTVATSEGTTATVTIRCLTERTLEVVVEPSAPETLAAFGERLRSPASE